MASLIHSAGLALALAIIVAGAIWIGIWWRLRGGGFTALTGLDPGTGGMRALAAAGMSAPLIGLGGLWWALMVPALWIAWSLAGWGAFQGMGRSPVGDKNPVERVLSRYLAPLPMCLIGMAIEGAYTMTLPGAVTGWCVGSPLLGLLVMLSGTGFAPIYYCAQHLRTVPDLGRFEHGGSELAECLVGAWVGVVLTASALAASMGWIGY